MILAAPIGPRNAVAELAGFDAVIDDVVCLGTPAQFTSVGQGYVDFGQTSDSEVCDLLQRSRAAGPGSGTAARGRVGWRSWSESSGWVMSPPSRLQRAERRNALNTELVDQLREAIERRPPTTCA